jgi:hypothetical protein
MPAYLVTPLSFGYRPDERLRVLWSPSQGSFAVHATENQDARDAIKVMADWPPLSLSAIAESVAPSAPLTADTIALWRKVYRCDLRYPPRERRQLARAKGRRRAIAVPMFERREVTFYQPDDRLNIVQVAGELMLPVMRAWRCPWWRRGRPIESALVPVPPTAMSAGCSWASPGRRSSP